MNTNAVDTVEIQDKKPDINNKDMEAEKISAERSQNSTSITKSDVHTVIYLLLSYFVYINIQDIK